MSWESHWCGNSLFSFLSLHQKRNYLLSVLQQRTFLLLFLKVHRITKQFLMNAGSWPLLPVNVNVSVMKTLRGRSTAQPLSFNGKLTWKRHSLVSKKSKISQKGLIKWWRRETKRVADVTLHFLVWSTHYFIGSHGPDKPDGCGLMGSRLRMEAAARRAISKAFVKHLRQQVYCGQRWW